MRPTLIILSLLFSLTTFGQKYSGVIKDTAIINFMFWLLGSDTSFKATRHVDDDILKLHSDNFIYADTATLNNYQYAQNIFGNKNNLTQFFNQDDANYFVKQIQAQRKNKWQLKFKNIKLYDTIQLVNNRVDKVLYS